MKKISVFLLVFVLLSSAFLPMAIHARDGGEDNSTSNTLETQKEELNQKIQDRKNQLEQLKAERKTAVEDAKDKAVAAKCSEVEKRVDTLINTSNTVHQKQVQRYTQIKANLVNAMQRLNDLGIDTSELESKLETLGTMILDYNDLESQFEDALNTSTTLVCGNSEGEYKNAIQQSKDLIQELKDKSKEIAQYWRDEIKPILEQYKEEVKSFTPASFVRTHQQ